MIASEKSIRLNELERLIPILANNTFEATAKALVRYLNNRQKELNELA